jgi:hypothetical protein
MVEGARMSVTPDNFLNIVNILVNEVFGDIIFALLVGLIFITYTCVKNNLPIKTTLALNVIFAMFVVSLYYDAFIIALIILVIGLIIVIGYQRLIREQNN